MGRFLFLVALVFSLSAFAQKKGSRTITSGKSVLTYDLGASSGSYNGASYSEINLGINYNFADSFTWRNSAFKRFGSNTTNEAGLDSTIRYNLDFRDENKEGINMFFGPGVRVATEKKSAALAEAGIQITFGGLRIGGGAKYLHYFDPGKDSSNVTLPKDETQYFITLAGGGNL